MRLVNGEQGAIHPARPTIAVVARSIAVEAVVTSLEGYRLTEYRDSQISCLEGHPPRFVIPHDGDKDATVGDDPRVVRTLDIKDIRIVGEECRVEISDNTGIMPIDVGDCCEGDHLRGACRYLATPLLLGLRVFRMVI